MHALDLEGVRDVVGIGAFVMAVVVLLARAYAEDGDSSHVGIRRVRSMLYVGSTVMCLTWALLSLWTAPGSLYRNVLRVALGLSAFAVVDFVRVRLRQRRLRPRATEAAISN